MIMMMWVCGLIFRMFWVVLILLSLGIWMFIRIMLGWVLVV